MTMPTERYDAVERTRNFLYRISLDYANSPDLRQEAHRCLKHFPEKYHMTVAREECPEIFGESND
jgi:hypothetical protein